MSLTCSAVLAASPLDLNAQECEPSVSAKSTPIAEQSYESTGPTSRSTKTCEHLRAPMSEQLTLFAAVTHVSHSVSPGSDWARQMTVTSGRNIAVLSKNSGPLGSLEKTLLGTSIWASTTCYLTWKHLVTPGGRLLFRLVPWMQSTDEIGSGLWATPAASSGSARHTGTWTGKYFITPNGQKAQTRLIEQVRMWPTPSVCGNYNRKGASKTSGDGLATAVKMFPTPTARDHKDCATSKSNLERGRTAGDFLGVAVGGALNPTWVEWLMGYPEGWTALEPSEMPSSRKSRKLSAAPLCEPKD